MPRPFTKLVLRTRIIKRANMEGDDSIDPDEWDSLMSEVYGELVEEVDDAGSRHFETTTTFTTAGLAYLNEPADQLAMIDNLELITNATTGRARRLYPVQPAERAALSGLTGDPRRYELVAGKLYLYPTPNAGSQIILRYIPQAADLTAYADGDSVDVVCAAGEAFLIWGTAAIGKSKDERFVDYAEGQKEKARVRLQQWARNRAFTSAPRRIVEDEIYEDGEEDY
jgi:hypothetical protein